MTRFFATSLSVVVLASVGSVVGFVSEASASAVTVVSFTPTSTAAYAPVAWDINFKSTTALAANGTITAVFPSAVTVPATASTYVTLLTGFTGCTVNSTVATTVSTHTAVVTLGTGCALAANTSAEFALSGFNNPVAQTLTNTGFTVATSTDTTAVSPTSSVTITTQASVTAVARIKSTTLATYCGTSAEQAQGVAADANIVWEANPIAATVCGYNESTGALQYALTSGDVYTFTSSQTTPSTTTPVTTGLGGGSNPNGVAIDATHLWVTLYGSAKVAEFSLGTDDAPTFVQDVTVGTDPYGISDDGTHTWVANYASGTLTEIPDTCTTGTGNCTTATVAYTTLQGAAAGTTGPLQVSSDGTHVWVTTDNNGGSSDCADSGSTADVIELLASTGAYVGKYNLAGACGIYSDGTHVWASSYSQGTLSELNIAATPTLAATVQLGVGSEPQGVTVGTDGLGNTDAWVTDYGTNQVSEVSTSGPTLVNAGALTLTSNGVNSAPRQITDYNGNVWVGSFTNNTDILEIHSTPLITTTSLPSGTYGTAYSQTVSAVDGQTAYTWSVASGSLPTGLSLNSSTGVISGTPTSVSGSPYSFVLKATDQGGIVYGEQAYSVTVNTATLTITAANQSINYGATTPTNSSTPTGFVSPDAGSVTSATYTYTGINGTTYAASTTAPTAVGTYSITPSAATVNFTTGSSSNYTYSYVAGTYTISQNTSLTLSFGTAPSSVVYGGSPTVTATPSPNIGTVVYSSATPSVCSVNSSTGVVTTLAQGTCTINANDSGNTNYAAASQVQQSFSIGTATLTITAANQSINYGATTPTNSSTPTGFVSPDAGSVTSATYTYTGINGTTYAASTTAPTNVGTYSITPSAATVNFTTGSSSNYTYSYVAGTYTISQNTSLTLAFGTAPSGVTYGGSSPTVTATPSPNVGSVVYSSATPSVCTVNSSSGRVTIVSAGSCTINANDSGNSSYAAASQVQQTFSIATATLTITAANQSINYGAATPTNSSTPTGFKNSDAGSVASATYTYTGINGTTYAASTTAPTAVGTYSITPSAATVNFTTGSSSNYAYSYVAGTYTISQAAVSLSFGTAPSGVTYGGSSPTVTATPSPSVGSVVYSSATPSVCTVNSSTGVVTIVTAGTCTIDANDAGNSSYAAASQVQQSFSIASATLTITAANQSINYGAATPTNSSTPTGFVSPDAGSVTSATYTYTGINGTTYAASTTAPTNVGTYSITPSAATVNFTTGSSSNYTYSYVAGTYTISQNTSLALTFGAAPSGVVFGGSPTVTATPGPNVGSVVYSSATPSVCSVNSSTGVVTTLGQGTCTINANDSGNSNYAAASQVQQSFSVATATLTITAANQSINYGASTPTNFSTPTGFVSPNAGSVTSATYTYAGTGSTTYGPSTTAPTAVGTYSITPSAATVTFTNGSSSNYAYSYVAGTYVISQNTTLSLSFGAAPSGVTYGGSSPTVTATPNHSTGGAVTYTSATPSVCTVNSSTGVVTIVGQGTCTIDANDPGDANYAAASQVAQSFSIAAVTPVVTAGSHTITYGGSFTNSATVTGTVNGDTATASNVTYTYAGTGSTTYGPSTTAPTNVGTYSITPSNATLAYTPSGHASNYNAPTYVAGTLIINQNTSLALSFGATPTGVTYGGSSPTVTATPNPTGVGTVVYSSSTTGVCTVDPSTGVVTIVSQGTCTIDANDAGTTNYAAATQVAQSFNIAKAGLTITAAGHTISFGQSTPANSATPTGFKGSDAGTVTSATYTYTGTGSTSYGPSTTAPTAPGTYSITPSSATVTYTTGSASNYTNSYVAGTYTITQASLSLTNGTPPTGVTYGQSPTVSATVTQTGTGTAPVYSSATPGVCTVNATTGVVTTVAAGSCTIDINDPGNTDYSAAPQLTQTFTIATATLTVTANSQGVPFGNAVPSNSSTVSGLEEGDSGVTVTSATYTYTGINGTTYPASTTAPTAVGTYSITPSAATLNWGSVVSSNYNVVYAPGVLNITTSSGLSLSFNTPPTNPVYGTTTTVVATPNPPGVGTVVYASTTPLVCTVNASTGVVTIVGVGNCTIDANDAGGGGYTAATQISETFATAPATLNVTAANQSEPYGTAVPTDSSTVSGYGNGDSGVTVTSATYTYTGINGTNYPASTTAPTAVGTYSITPSAATLNWASVNSSDYNSTDNYLSGTLTITTANLTLIPGTLPTPTYGQTPTVTATVLPSGTGTSPVFATNSPACSVDPSTGVVTIIQAGQCVITVSDPGNGNYNPATSINESFTITPAMLTVTAADQTVPFLGVVPTDTATVTAGLVGSDSAAVTSATYTYTGINGTTYAASTTAPTAVGTYSITPSNATLSISTSFSGNYSGTYTYVAGTLTIAAAAQIIVFSSSETNPAIGDTYIPVAAASSGLPVTLSIDSSSAGVCTLSAGTVTFTGAGTCTIDANQGGGGGWDPAAQTAQSIVVPAANVSNPNSPPQITTTSLPGASVGTAYSVPIAETGGTGPFYWSAVGLPAGLSINPATGVISGMPTTAQATPALVTVTVIDANGLHSSQSYTLPVISTITLDPATNVSPLAGDSQALVSFTPSVNAVDFTGVSYTVTAGPGGESCTTTGYVCLVKGLTNGVVYTFTVVASALSPAAISVASVGVEATPTPNPIVLPPGGTTGTVGTQPAKELSPGQGVATQLDGSQGAAKVTTTADSVTVSGAGLVMTITAQSTVATPSGATVLLIEGGKAKVSGKGFYPGTYVDVYVFSKEVFLGQVLVQANGTYSATLPIPASIPVGTHTVLSQGFVASGKRASVSVGVLVEADEASLLLYPFATGESTLTPKMITQLRNFALTLKKDGVLSINVTGYTDSRDTAAYNLALGERRATTVATYLKALLVSDGVSLSGVKLTIRSLGLSAPAATNSTAAGRARNRNVTVTVTLKLI